jgi:hypothetical protein
MIVVALVVAATVLFTGSCAKQEEKPETEQAAVTGNDHEGHEHGERTIKYIDEDVSLGIFFDQEGTKRTLHLADDAKEFIAYIIIKLPDYLEINAVEYQLELPEGLTIVNDKYLEERTIVMGHFDHGISEAFPCMTGPQIVLHELTFRTAGPLDNAVIGIAPHRQSKQVAVTKCSEGYPIIKVSAYRAVVNPEE